MTATPDENADSFDPIIQHDEEDPGELFNRQIADDDQIRLVLRANGQLWVWTSTGMPAPELGEILKSMGEHFSHGEVHRVQ